MIDLASFRLALALLCVECFAIGLAATTASWFLMIVYGLSAAYFYAIVYINARRAITLVNRALAEQQKAAHKERARRFICSQRGCTQTDGKPCDFEHCPNREARQ